MAKKTDPLSVLNVIDRLEVGPVKIEPRRLQAPYKVVQGDKTDVFEFQYSYDEDVFDPADPAARNLACVMAAQAALNYGLFAGELVFRGLYDEVDRKFLEAAAVNTAREIYVKKFLEPNPFLIGEAAKLPVVKAENYLRAKLVFPGEPDGLPLTSRSDVKGPPPRSMPSGEAKLSGETKTGADAEASAEAKAAGETKLSADAKAGWNVDRLRHAVLSSGGKDSLVSFGVLNEIGVEAHPIFVNESGRHWFTALNAYRHFSGSVPKTARVWVNSDRLFVWMLKHLPFIRPDFAGVRADEYPIRLWTVAVFVFGALPLLRKRGIGRMVIGDEHDTTRRRTYRGVPHYDGLYDQSRYFDNSLTRYYYQKRWDVAQFSLLRPLSELLIEKVLAVRYPELHKLQVSCHAAHLDGERAFPCGQCEKCRRIVGMLTALGQDARACGYTDAQIEQCVKSLAGGGNHQEVPDLQQLAFMLWQKGIVPEPRLGSVRAVERPEILQLRFDPVRSPIDATPADLREKVWGMFLRHAGGAVRRQGRLWIDFDVLNDPARNRAYPFEAPSERGRKPSGELAKGPAGPADYVLGELTWPQARERFREIDIALLPVGSIEQHGPHLPLNVDSFDADYLARKVAEGCGAPRPLVLPLVSYGVSYHHEDFSGTISLDNETLARMAYEIGMSCARNGITKLVIINAHGGNAPALHFAAQRINRDARIFTCVDSGESSDADIAALAETVNDVHAGEIETSTTLATRPELVALDKARKSVPRFSSRYLDFSSRRSVGWYGRTQKISPTGVMGDPTKASREKGEKMWEVMIRNLVEFVEQLKRMSLDEIYQRRQY
jgi:creatinine amidohydrolase/Fe(II)-dependent formamide hydrolase-like protein